MIVGNKNAVDADQNEMGSGGEQYKPKDPQLSATLQKPPRCLFKNFLLGLMALFSLSVVAVMTWIISKSAYQVKSNETPVNDVISAAYLLSKMDLSVDPCEDFYQYACGSWIQSQWEDDVSVMLKASDQYGERIKKYLNEEILDSDLVSYKNVKLLYQACVSPDSDLTDAKGWLKKLFNLPSIEEVMDFAAELGLFVFYEVNIDTHPLSMDVISRNAWRLNGDSIDAMIKEFSEFQDLGQKDTVVNFIETMGSLGGDTVTETTIGDFITRTTFVNLTNHFKTFGLSPSDKIRSDSQLIEKTSQFIADNFADDGAELLKFAKTYTGCLVHQRYIRLAQIQRSPPFCYSSFASSYFGFTVGSLMLDREKANYTDTLATVQEMVSIITEEYRQTVRESELLSFEGKSSAVKKLDNLKVLVGAAPWIKNDTHLQQLSYDEELDESMSFIKMYKLVNNFYQRRKIQSILHPTVSDLWEVTMGPQVVLNAAYYQHENAISVPIGAFISPYFDSKWPLEMKYGALGSIVGHEITHAFDQNGMHFDSKGKRNELWDSKDAESVRNEQTCLINQYNGFGHTGYHINGTRTLNENFADNGGLPVAYRAYKTANKSRKPFKIHGLDLTSDQLFFLTYAQMRCYKYSTDGLEYEYEDNIYSPPDFRVTGPIMNNHHFSKAFSCSSDSEMTKSNSLKCRTL